MDDDLRLGLLLSPFPMGGRINRQNFLEVLNPVMFSSECRGAKVDPQLEQELLARERERQKEMEKERREEEERRREADRLYEMKLRDWDRIER